MKLFKNIHSYYPSNRKGADQLEGFIILRLEDLIQNIDHSALADYKVPHLRDFFEVSIGVNQSKSAGFQIGEKEFSSVKNDLVFVSPIQPFSVNFNGSKDYQSENQGGFLIAFKPSFVIRHRTSFEIINAYRYFNSHTLPQYVIKPKQLEPIIEVCEKMIELYTNGYSGSKDILMGYLDVLLHCLNQLLETDSNEMLENSNTIEFLAISFEKMIIRDGSCIKSVSYYSEKLNVSPNYLSECVKKVTGKNARQVLMSHKLVVAKSLLQNSGKTITQIADDMGFTESTNFTKFFKSMTGMTPGQFRKR